MSINAHTRTMAILMGAFLVIITLFSAFVYLSVTDYYNEDFDRLLETRVKAIAHASSYAASGDSAAAAALGFIDLLPHERDFIFPEGTPLAQMASETGAPQDFFEDILRNGSAYLEIEPIGFRGMRHTDANGSNRIIVATAQDQYRIHHDAYLLNNLIAAILAASVLAFAVSLYFSKAIFRPLHHITEQVKQISTESLHLRLSEEQGGMELKELAATFNYMLDRIETSFETQNNFISNASHELRTPLTAIIGEADVALAKPRQPEEYVETIKVILEEAEQLESKTKALLFLAQTGFNGGKAKFGKVRIDQLLYDVKGTVERVNAKHRVHLDLSLLPENPMRLKVLGNEQLLHLAFSNIIMNGCKYSDNKPVTVSLGTSADRVIVAIKDSGIGISTEDLKHIYDPFFRGANTKGYEGYGIGLPLTQNIIRMHGGELAVSSIVEVGTTVQVSLPIGKFAEAAS